jgi:hypothetical protein
MAKKKLRKKNDKTTESAIPEFKPGNKPYCKYDGSVLNANVPWCEVVQELKQRGFTQTQIAQYAECGLQVIKEVLSKKYGKLCFRAGARIITMHSNYYPHAY